MNISEIRHEIEVCQTFISRDQETISELRSALDALGDVEAEILHWRVVAARERKPVDVVPLRLSQKRIEADALRQTIAATEAIIEGNQAKIAELEQDLERQLDASLDESWQVISAEANRLAQVLLAQQKAYTDTARQMFALNALARPGKSEWFKGETQQIFAPPLPKQLKTPRQQAECLDQFGYQALIKPVVDEAKAWRTALVEDKSAPSPFAEDKNVAASFSEA